MTAVDDSWWQLTTADDSWQQLTTADDSWQQLTAEWQFTVVDTVKVKQKLRKIERNSPFYSLVWFGLVGYKPNQTKLYYSWLLQDFWRTSEGLLKDFWRTPEGLLKDFWRTSEGLLKDFQKTFKGLSKDLQVAASRSSRLVKKFLHQLASRS